MVKVLITDDSAFMRQELKRILTQDPEIEVIGTAFDGLDAINKISKLHPDVVTLDVEMPQMDGLTALRHIMITSPLPVIMISSLTHQGAETTFEAIRLGAIDFITKPSGTISLDIGTKTREIIDKVKAAAKVDCSKIKRLPDPPTVPLAQKEIVKPLFSSLLGKVEKCPMVVAIGVSTGGPQTLMQIIPKLPGDLPAAVMVVQHMPPVFTKNFADRLNNISQLTVIEAQQKDKIVPGTVYIAPGDYHMTTNNSGTYIELSKEPSDTLHRPSVDVMMNSVCKVFGKNIVGVILTGMGRDGAAALKKIHDAGCKTIAESEATAVVYGMPREAVKLEAADFIIDNDKIASKIVDLVKAKAQV